MITADESQGGGELQKNIGAIVMVAAAFTFIATLVGAIWAYGQLPQWHNRWWFIASLVIGVAAPTVGAWLISRGDEQAHAALMDRTSLQASEQAHIRQLFGRDKDLERRIQNAYPYGYAILGLDGQVAQWLPGADQVGLQNYFSVDPKGSLLRINDQKNKLLMQIAFDWTQRRSV
jgi:hypothetical protein